MDVDFQSKKQHQHGSDSHAIWLKSAGVWLESTPIHLQI